MIEGRWRVRASIAAGSRMPGGYDMILDECPVGASDPRVEPWVAEVVQAYQLQRRLGIQPARLDDEMRAALLVLDTEVRALEAVEHERARERARAPG